MIDPKDAIVFPCIEVRQPIGSFYIGAIDSNDLVLISYADMRAIKEGQPRDVEEFSGIQRQLSPQRVAELKQYVTTIDASFPTSIILQIGAPDAEYTAKGAMRVRRDKGVAKIIDGQHRIAGLEGYKGPPFELGVAIFIDMDPEDQALLFATINLKQNKVNKSLAYDLYDFAQARSPQKTCHNIARLLNARPGSPFFQKIKILGTATADREETITQAAFIDNLIGYISVNPMKDRDAIKRGRELPATHDSQRTKLIFRGLFKSDRDAEIARIIWNYFAAVQARWPAAWAEKTKGLILNRTTGFIALMRFLRVVYLKLAEPEGVPTEAEFYEVFKRIDLPEDGFTPARYLPGTGGTALLYHDLLNGSGLSE